MDKVIDAMLDREDFGHEHNGDNGYVFWNDSDLLAEVCGSGAGQGLYSKYEVTRDGEPVPGAFVLKPETDVLARRALETYATLTPNRVLASQLWEWLYKIERDQT